MELRNYNMTNEQILKKVIEKAVKNGWNDGDTDGDAEWILFNWCGDAEGLGIEEEKFESLMFNHSFAQALWGEDRNCDCKPIKLSLSTVHTNCNSEKKTWQYHLQQLAISTDRIKYLEKFI